METKNVEMQQVMDRLARVERQNRWLVRGALTLVLSCGIVLLIAQKPVAQTVEAQAFVLKDVDGKVRAELHMTDSGAELTLHDSQHRTSARLYVDELGPGLDLNAKEGDLVSLLISDLGPHLFLQKGKVDARLAVDGDRAFLGLMDSGTSMWAIVDKDGPNLDLKSLGGSTSTAVDKEGPYLYLKDSAGYRASIGSQPLVTPTTGEKSQTSASSIHLFDPKGKILWSAP